MVDPKKITFEDSIRLILKNFIRKSSAVSDIIYRVFPCLEKVFEKNKRCFGGSILFDTLNCYIFYGRERFVQDKAAIEMLFRIADITLFTMTPNVIQNNSEGAIFL